MSLLTALEDADRNPSKCWGFDSRSEAVDSEEDESPMQIACDSPGKDDVYQFVASDDEMKGTSTRTSKERKKHVHRDDECVITSRTSPTAVSCLSSQHRNPKEYKHGRDQFKIPRKTNNDVDPSSWIVKSPSNSNQPWVSSKCSYSKPGSDCRKAGEKAIGFSLERKRTTANRSITDYGKPCSSRKTDQSVHSGDKSSCAPGDARVTRSAEKSRYAEGHILHSDSDQEGETIRISPSRSSNSNDCFVNAFVPVHEDLIGDYSDAENCNKRVIEINSQDEETKDKGDLSESSSGSTEGGFVWKNPSELTDERTFDWHTVDGLDFSEDNSQDFDNYNMMRDCAENYENHLSADRTVLVSDISIVPASDRRIVPANDRRIVPTNDRRIVPASDRRIVPTSDRRIVPANDRRIVPANDRRIVPASDRRIVPASDRRIVPASDRRIVPASDRCTVPVSDRSIVPASDKSIVLASNRSIVPVDSSQIQSLSNRTSRQIIYDNSVTLQVVISTNEVNSMSVHDLIASCNHEQSSDEQDKNSVTLSNRINSRLNHKAKDLEKSCFTEDDNNESSDNDNHIFENPSKKLRRTDEIEDFDCCEHGNLDDNGECTECCGDSSTSRIQTREVNSTSAATFYGNTKKPLPKKTPALQTSIGPKRKRKPTPKETPQQTQSDAGPLASKQRKRVVKKKDHHGSADNPVELLSSSDEDEEKGPNDHLHEDMSDAPTGNKQEDDPSTCTDGNNREPDAKPRETMASRMKLPKGKTISPGKENKRTTRSKHSSELLGLFEKLPLQAKFDVHRVRVGTAEGIATDLLTVSAADILLPMESGLKSVKLRIEKEEVMSFMIYNENKEGIIALEVNQKCALRLSEKFTTPARALDPGSPVEGERKIVIGLREEVSKQTISDLEELITYKWKSLNLLHYLSTEEADQIRSFSPFSIKADTLQCSGSANSSTAGSSSNSTTEIRTYNTRSGKSAKSNDSPVKVLIIFPPPPILGGISVTTEDIQCLDTGEYVNDVIIDFYLKYIVEKQLSTEDKLRTHIFNSFFYKRLTRKEKGANLKTSDPPRSAEEKMHMRVSNWTKNVDIFSKDFLIVPIVENAHWYVVVICFPGHEKPVPINNSQETQDTQNEVEEDDGEEEEEESSDSEMLTLAAGVDKLRKSNTSSDACNELTPESVTESAADKAEDMETLREDFNMSNDVNNESGDNDTGPSQPDSNDMNQTAILFPSDTEMDRTTTPSSSKEVKPAKRVARKITDLFKPAAKNKTQPCILVFDSLGCKGRPTMLRNLRGYLTEEWKSKKSSEKPRIFTKDNIKANFPVVPQQNNFCDCGVFLLQYVESFFKSPFQEFTLPVKVPDWFEQQVIERKRQEIKDLIYTIKNEST